MSIKVDINQLDNKSAYAASIASQLKQKAEQLNMVYYNLDLNIKSRYDIGNSILIMQNRINNVQVKMYDIGMYLAKAAERYNIAEAGIVKSASTLGLAVSVNVAAQGDIEKNKSNKDNWLKLAVGVAVIGVAAAAIAIASAVATPFVVGIAVGAAIGAGVGAIIGGLTGGIVSKINGGSFWDGAASGFMWGAIGGAVTGGFAAVGAGIVGTAAVEGAVNTGIYVGQTLENGGDVTLIGITTSFAVGAGFSAISTVVSNKISGYISKQVGKKVKFTYKNNPMDNPKAAKDIMENAEAIYGYSPKPESDLNKFNVDWTNPEQVADAQLQRIKYHEGLELEKAKLNLEVENMLKEGYSVEDIARMKVADRNTHRIDTYIKEGNLEGLESMKARNMRKYQNPDGPTPEQLFNKYGSWEEVIYASVRSNPGMDACTGLYDIYGGI